MTQMIDSQSAVCYGTVLYELQVPKEDILESRKMLSECPELMEILCCPVAALEQKLAVIDRVFPRSMGNFMKSVCRNGRCGLLNSIFQAYDTCADERSRTLKARLICVTPPDEGQRAGIVRRLCRRYHMENVDLDIVIDKTLIGGFIIQAGGYEMDYSIRGRYRQLEKKLSGGE